MTESNQGGINPKVLPSTIQNSDTGVFISSKDVILERVLPSTYTLSYTFFLIPRIPSQQLIGDLADNLPHWLEMICVSFDWKLEFVTVSPDFFQWALSVGPAISIGRIIEHIRSKTSEMIFANFNQLKEENIFDDFWAIGYLSLSGVQTYPKVIVERYLKMIRQQGEC